MQKIISLCPECKIEEARDIQKFFNVAKFSDCNGAQTHNHVVQKQSLNHLGKKNKKQTKKQRQINKDKSKKQQK